MQMQEADLLLHDGGCAGDAVAVQGGVDAVARPLEQSTSDALRTGSHCCSILATQLLHQLGKLSSKVRTCISTKSCCRLVNKQHSAYASCRAG